jgi:A/G-specific adenine glycosylase
MPQDIKVIQTKLVEWGNKNYDHYPWRSAKNKFHALIAEIMLQRTNAEKVVPIYNIFILTYPKIKNISEKEEEKLINLLKPLGLQKRNKNIIKLIKKLSKVPIPKTKNGLTKLPGIGNYTANAFLSLHLGVKASIIDVNGIRLWTRILGIKNAKLRIEKADLFSLIDTFTPEKEFKEFNYAVLDFSRKICKKRPKCEICPIIKECSYVKQIIP